MRHMLAGNNLGLISCRQQSQQGEWTLIGVTKWVTECCAISNKTKEANYIFPLYLYQDRKQKELFDISESSSTPDGRRPNFTQQFIDAITNKIQLNFILDGKGDLQKTCQKWLRDRKGRALTFDDIKHYQKIIAALEETMHLMGQIDEVIEEHEGWPIE
jgi:Type ISP C-terminal specificity domain